MRRIGLLFVLVFLMLVGCTNQQTQNDAGDRLRVVASFYPVADFTNRIGGDLVEVETLVGSGSDPHSWEMTTTDRNKVERADLFIYNGAGFEHWVEDLLPTLENKELVIVESAKTVDPAEAQDAHEEDDHEEDAHDHGVHDAHTWISLKNAVRQMEVIKEALSEKDSANKESYEANFAAQKKAFEALDAEAKALFSDVPRKDFIVGHESFGYFARDYGLTQHGIEGAASHGEPDPATMAELVRLARDKDIRVVFYDPLGSDKTALAIASEIGGETAALNPLEGRTAKEEEQGMGTLEIMEQNIRALHKALTIQ